MAMTLGVLTYDIANNRRRARVHLLLEAYGIAVQESVFLLDLSPARWTEVERKLLVLINRREDDIRVWPLCSYCRGRAAVWSGPGRQPPGAVEII
ncbi:MAG: CRISPR-associated endonuclease Cas2 [Dehalococcoidia bacterium]